MGFSGVGANGKTIGDNIDPLLANGGLGGNVGSTRTIALRRGSPAVGAITLTDCKDQASPPNPLLRITRPEAPLTACHSERTPRSEEISNTGGVPCPVTTFGAIRHH
jgi:hypothetical protein